MNKYLNTGLLANFYFAIIILFNLACESKDKFVVENSVSFSHDDFQFELHLNGKDFVDVSDSLFQPSLLFIQGDNLLINDEVTNNTMHVVDLKSKVYLGRRGKRGAGPGEALNIWTFFSVGKDTLGLFDTEQGKILLYDMDSLIRYDNGLLMEYSNRDLVYSKSVIINNRDLLFLGNPLKNATAKSRFYVTDLLNSKYSLEGIGDLPKPGGATLDQVSKEWRAKFIDARMNGFENIIVILYENHPYLEIFNFANGEKIGLAGPDLFPNENFFGEICYHSLSYVTSEYIYILYVTNREYADYNSNTILVFDHSGKPIMKLILDKNIYSFAIHNDRDLYGLTENLDSFEYNIIKYEFDI
ncbi:BF3164 family lipoprotein [Algoriphagus namhaensis]